MPRNSCTIILNGHGCYTPLSIVNINQINFNLIFLCGLNQTVSNSHHNLLLNSLVIDHKQTLDLLEKSPTTYISNNTFSINNYIINMNGNQTPFIYEHGLSSALNVTNVQSFTAINNQRFVFKDILCNQLIRTWQGVLRLEFDKVAVENDVINSYQNPNYIYNKVINLSSENLLYFQPRAIPNQILELKLSDLLIDILPKIKIPIVYHGLNKTAEVLPIIFLDDNNGSNIVINGVITDDETGFRQYYPNLFNHQQDVYHEMTISGDSNIVWDACRELSI